MEKQNTQHSKSLDSFILESTPQRVRARYHALASYAAEHLFGSLDENIVVLDTETTGFSFNHDELIQIAAARMARGRIVDWYITFVNPGKPIPEEVAHLTNIHDSDVADAPSVNEALSGLVAFVGDASLVAHNAAFDRTFCTKAQAGEPLTQNLWFDSLDLARIALPRMKSHRLLDLARAFGVPESTHRADADVAATCQIYRILLAAVATMPRNLVGAIAQMSSSSEWNTAQVFKVLCDCAPQLRPNAANVGLAEAEPTDAANSAIAQPEELSFNLRALRKKQGSFDQYPVKLDANKPLSAQGEGAGPLTEKTAPRELTFAPISEIDQAFSADGLVGSLYENYEPREEQREMARAIQRALSVSRNLVVEAGTGVGKSMAYLVPLALAARENNMTVGVATKTNALLDQLVHKELPLLAGVLGTTYAPLKGFAHYICLRKVEELIAAGPKLVSYKNQLINQTPSFAGLLSYIEQTEYDDFDALKIDYRAVPRWRISTKSTECLKRKCPFFGRACFVHGARERAQRCDIVVTNHSLLYWDVRFDGGLLPPIRHWVIDEAHGAESEARRSLAQAVSSEAIQRLVRKLTAESAHINVLTRVQSTALLADDGQELFDRLVSKARTRADAFGIAAEEFALSAKDLLEFEPRSKGKGYEYCDLWLSEEIRRTKTFQGVRDQASTLYDTAEKLIAVVRDIVAYGEQAEDTSPAQRELALVALELRELYESLEVNFLRENTNTVHSVRLNKTKSQLDDVFTVQPLDVGALLDETFYQETRSVIYTSATLSVDRSFFAFSQAMGLNAGEGTEADVIQVDSSFDFDSQMHVFVPTDIPEPNEAGYLEALQAFLVGLHRAQAGSMLTLFTNRRDMERCFDAVNPQIKQDDLRLVCQKWGVSVKGLRDDFLRDEHLSLFALKSFWEGFDAPGATLRGVVIPKLPFGLPTDPLSCERQARDDRAWAHYSLPAAVIEVKQAVGRLIRKASDKGIVVLADKRLISKYYGKKFLNSLPSKTITCLPCADIVAEVARLHETEAIK